jgi:tetratricopeptide (TPR) repeat protein
MKTNDFSYFIERYNAGEMNNDERLWFQKELEGNDKLRQEVHLRERTEEILKSQDILSLRNKLSRIESNRTSNVTATKPKKPTHLKYAALIAALVIIGSLAVFHGRNLSLEEIISQNRTVYQPSTGQRSLQTSTNEDFIQGLEYYNISDFKNAAFHFSKVVESNPKDMAATLLNGISNYQENQFHEAKLSFGKVIDDNKNLYIDQAQWYLALCYLKTEEKEKAVQLLGIIREEKGFYARDAKNILRKIK